MMKESDVARNGVNWTGRASVRTLRAVHSMTLAEQAKSFQQGGKFKPPKTVRRFSKRR